MKKPKLSKLEQFQKIVDEKQYGKVDGLRVDLFSASAVVAVWNALKDKPEALGKFLSFRPDQMIRLAFKLVK